MTDTKIRYSDQTTTSEVIADIFQIEFELIAPNIKFNREQLVLAFDTLLYNNIIANAMEQDELEKELHLREQARLPVKEETNFLPVIRVGGKGSQSSQ